MDQLELAPMRVDIVFDGRRTEAHVTIESGTPNLCGLGTARCREDDHYDPRIGGDIALGRALQELGERVEAEAARLVVTEEQARLVLDGAGL